MFKCVKMDKQDLENKVSSLISERDVLESKLLKKDKEMKMLRELVRESLRIMKKELSPVSYLPKRVSEQTKRMTYLEMNNQIQIGKIRVLEDQIMRLKLQWEREVRYLQWQMAKEKKNAEKNFLAQYEEMQRTLERNERKAANTESRLRRVITYYRMRDSGVLDTEPNCRKRDSGELITEEKAQEPNCLTKAVAIVSLS